MGPHSKSKGPHSKSKGPHSKSTWPALRVWAPCANPASEAAGVGAQPAADEQDEEKEEEPTPAEGGGAAAAAVGSSGAPHPGVASAWASPFLLGLWIMIYKTIL